MRAWLHTRQWALVALVAAGLGACTGDDTYLPALRADPVASLELQTADLHQRWAEAQVESDFLGKPSYASILSVYQIHSEFAPEAALEEAVLAARSAGWVFDPAGAERREGGSISMSAYKQLAPGSANLFISVSEERRSLTFSLDFGADPPWSRALDVSLGSTVILRELSHRTYVTFEAEAGDTFEIDLDLPRDGLDRASVGALSGSTLWSAADVGGSVTIGPETVEESATYVAFFDPRQIDDGPLRMEVRGGVETKVRDIAVSMPLRSSIGLELEPGQDAHITFSAPTPPEWLSMQVSTAFRADDLRVTISTPGGAALWTDTRLHPTNRGAAVFLDTVELSSEGSYTIDIEIDGGAADESLVEVDLFEPTRYNEDTQYEGFEVPYRLGNDLYVPGSIDRWPLNGAHGEEIRVHAASNDLTTTDGSDPGLVLEVVSPEEEIVWSGESRDGYLESDRILLSEEGPYWLVMDGIGATIGHFTVNVDLCTPGRFRC